MGLFDRFKKKENALQEKYKEKWPSLSPAQGNNRRNDADGVMELKGERRG